MPILLKHALVPKIVGIAILIMHVLTRVHHLEHVIEPICGDLWIILSYVHTYTVTVDVVMLPNQRSEVTRRSQMMHERIVPQCVIDRLGHIPAYPVLGRI